MPQERHDDLPASLDQESTWSNPSKISRKVRELAVQSHKALKAVSQPHVAVPVEAQNGLADLERLRTQVARLQQKIHARRLGVLIPWVDALRQRIEDRLGSKKEDNDTTPG